MLRFKQFLIEGVVDQIKHGQSGVGLLSSNLINKGLSDNLGFAGTQVLGFVEPARETTTGNYAFLKKGYKYPDGTIRSEDKHRIKLYTDNPQNISNPRSEENSTLRHELQHLWQKNKQLSKNPSSDLENFKKYNLVKGVIPEVDDYMNQYGLKSKISYLLDPQEINARGIQRGGDAIQRHNDLARSKITSDPKFLDFEFELEKSGGRAKAPSLDPNIGRIQADRAFDATITTENEYLSPARTYSRHLKPKDSSKVTRGTDKAIKAVASDIARGLQSNVEYAQSVAQDAYDDKVIRPQRERANRVTKMKAEFNVTKPMGFNSGVFMSDPISTSNFAYDVAGAMGDVRTKDQTMKKAAASLNNPMYSDSEQMMGDAFLRGGGEGYEVDPRFLQLDSQRKKDREEEKKRKAGPLSGPLQTMQRPD